MPIFTQSCQPGFIITCIYCGTSTVMEATFPLTLFSWADLPLPTGWEHRAFVDERVSKKPEVHPVCDTCTSLNDVALDEFHQRTERARDLLSIDGVPTMAGKNRRMTD